MERLLAKLRVTLFRRANITVGPVQLEVLERVGAEEVEAEGGVLDSMINEAARLLGEKRADFFLIEGESGETKYVLGEGVKDRSGTRLLYFTPQRLLRVGVLRLQGLQGAVTSQGYAKLDLRGIEWHEVPGEVYVYDGPLKAEEDVEYVVLETEAGVRVVRASRLSRLTLSLRPPTEQAQEPPAGGSGGGEGSSPEG